MKVETIHEQPLFWASYSSYNGASEDVPVFIEDVKEATLGNIWDAEGDNCGRDVHDVSYKLVYRDSSGAAVVKRVRTSSDDPNPIWDAEDILIWISFGKEA